MYLYHDLHDYPSNCKRWPYSLWLNMHDHQSKGWSCPLWLDLHGHKRPNHTTRKASSLAKLYKFLIYLSLHLTCFRVYHAIYFFLDYEIDYGSLSLPFHISRFTSGCKKMVQCSIPKDQTSLPSIPISAICSIRRQVYKFCNSLWGAYFGTQRLLYPSPCRNRFQCLVSESLKIVTD